MEKFGYAVACFDGSGKAVKREDAALDGLYEAINPLFDFLGTAEAESVISDAIDSLFQPHYAQDAAERELVWEVRCMPLLPILGTCS
ncbi:hypothetical protein SEA_OLICIOUS_86 [Streptomyces phage Olicious]|uniref:Uncharacterized protein n=4 Tax=Immanueltrevirus immanuel3 TaxID=2846399 RepID=A0A2H5BM30_9CAUD|nr:hypothetical protein SEA_HAUGEANATOR_86 [Streptomyces phage HaugeAnator]AUG87518.1 hypothetical protein SEA_ROMERO_86 [Streptomyces phage Romero]AUG87647.1 hypothetical protein SEA_ZOOBEAR_86 [Streptomyces phage ZooBear]AZF95873.1 hypothetical protein SEA_OLICIOUS_86 [Streptomyces phage Olicious]